MQSCAHSIFLSPSISGFEKERVRPGVLETDGKDCRPRRSRRCTHSSVAHRIHDERVVVGADDAESDDLYLRHHHDPLLGLVQALGARREQFVSMNVLYQNLYLLILQAKNIFFTQFYNLI